MNLRPPVCDKGRPGEIIQLLMGAFMKMSVRLGTLLLVAAVSFAGGGHAADWVERPYDPAVGSHWLIQSEERSESNKLGVTETTTVSITSRLNINERLPDGFRVDYVVQDITVDGQSREAELSRQMLGNLKGIAVRGKLDRGGKPVDVENYDEVKAKLKTMTDGMLSRFADKPEVAAILRKMFDSALLVDKERAPGVFFNDLPELAFAQNTGLKRGDVRKTAEAMPNPFGGAPIASTQSLWITMADADTGKARLVRMSALDDDSVKAFATAIAKQFAGATKDISAAQLDDLMKQVSLRNDRQTSFDVEGGMTRAVTDRSRLSLMAPGATFSKTETKTIKVSPAP
jgi:hypothetical protein